MTPSSLRHPLLFVFTVFLAACGSSPERPEVEEITPPAKYAYAYLADVSVTLMDEAPDEATLKDKQVFEAKIPALVKTAVEEEGLPFLDEAPAPRDGLIALKLTVSYHPGNRAARWLGGIFGAGKGTVEAMIEGVDPVTGTVVASRSEYDTKKMGFFGGDFYGMAESSVANVATELAEVLIEVRK